MLCADRRRLQTTEINELESVDIPRVSGHQNPTSSDGGTTSGSRSLSGKSRLVRNIFRWNPWDRARNCLRPRDIEKIPKVFLKVLLQF